MKTKKIKLSALYEETPEGVAFKHSKNLKHKIMKAMGLAAFHTKSRARDTNKGHRKRMGVAYAPQPRINTSPMPNKPRHRKFMGINDPRTPY